MAPIPGRHDDHFIANWALDGKSVIFMVNQGLWQVDADGTGLHELFESPAGNGRRSRTGVDPDGKHSAPQAHRSAPGDSGRLGVVSGTKSGTGRGHAKRR